MEIAELYVDVVMAAKGADHPVPYGFVLSCRRIVGIGLFVRHGSYPQTVHLMRKATVFQIGEMAVRHPAGNAGSLPALRNDL
jgi:hypothetical protein